MNLTLQQLNGPYKLPAKGANIRYNPRRLGTTPENPSRQFEQAETCTSEGDMRLGVIHLDFIAGNASRL